MKSTPLTKWGTLIKPDSTALDALRQARRVSEFADFPKSTQAIYLAVTQCFPGVQVFACGSRVRGDYVDASDGQAVREARRAAWMKDKPESDYDFFINGKPEAARELPPNTQQVRCKVPENEKVKIPMYVLELGESTGNGTRKTD